MIDVTDVSVTLMVDDLDRAQDFYQGMLGFDLTYRAGPHFCMLQRVGVKLGLHPRAEGPRAGDAPGGISIGLEVADIHASVEALRAAGVAFPDGVVDDDGAILRADFSDPDGTPLYLVERRAGA